MMMKKLLLLFIFLPFLSFAQRFEISETPGYSITSNNFFNSGFSNQVGLGFHFTKHFSLTAIYENEWWGTKVSGIGIAPDLNFKRFYFGMDFKEMYTKTYNYSFYGTIKYDPAFAYGFHIGTKHRIYKHLYFTDQFGLCFINVKETNSPNTTGLGYEYSQNESFNYFYFRLGLSYRF